MNKLFLHFKNFDWILFFSVFFIACFGLIEIYSIALGQETVNLLNFYKQTFFVSIGIFLLFSFSFLDYGFIKNISKYLYLFGTVALSAVLIFGKTIRGATSWFVIGSFNIQPTEFIKIILIIFLANFFATKTIKIRSLKQLFYSGFGSGIFIFLTLMQPDLGSAIILFSIWLAMLVITGFNKKIFISILVLMAISSVGMWSFYFKDYHKERIISLVRPDLVSFDQGYNVAQAMIAIGAGGIKGRGIGFGSQSQLKFLPEAGNDFIFAVISEEFGFIGIGLLFILLTTFFLRLVFVTRRISNDFGIFLILGVMGLIFIEMFINIGMNIGLLPVIGISLPFISYGGSAIISHFILIGIVQNIIIKSKISY